jgi:hypothetical protein
MAMFIHLAPEKRTKAILRSSLRLPRAREGQVRGVYVMAATKNHSVSHQRLRELKRSGQRTFVAIHVRVPDDPLVQVGHYGQAHATTSAAEAVAVVLCAGNAEGHEIVVPRAIRPAEIHAVRAVRQVVGWRYSPGSHGKRPCGCPACQPRGEIRSRKLRERCGASQ